MSRAVTITALSAFVVVDVLLVGAAIAHVRQDPPPSNLRPVADDAASSVDAQRPFDFDPARAAVISLAQDGTMVFGTRGECGGTAEQPGQVVVSSDAGATRKTVDAGVSHVLAAKASNGGDVVVVGLDDSCTALQVTTSNGGRSWKKSPKPTLWFPSPDAPGMVVTPSGSTTPGCTVTGLTQLGKRTARVTCADGAIRGTGNGTDWVDVGRLDNVRVAVFTSISKGYALARFDACAAQAFVTSDGGRTWSMRACIPGDPARAIDVNDSAVVAVVGEPPTLFTSADRGDAFKAVS